VKPPKDMPRGLPRDPDPYIAFDESWGPSLPRRNRSRHRRRFPLSAVLPVVILLAVLVILGSYLAGGVLWLVRK
jgi:hypothetical protein